MLWRVAARYLFGRGGFGHVALARARRKRRFHRNNLHTRSSLSSDRTRLTIRKHGGPIREPYAAATPLGRAAGGRIRGCNLVGVSVVIHRIHKSLHRYFIFAAAPPYKTLPRREADATTEHRTGAATTRSTHGSTTRACATSELTRFIGPRLSRRRARIFRDTCWPRATARMLLGSRAHMGTRWSDDDTRCAPPPR
jgi:hypothetical protein